MPLGSRHAETGLLQRENDALILKRDDGGRWRLDADRGAEAMLGARVRVIGERKGFDLLDVISIERC